MNCTAEDFLRKYNINYKDIDFDKEIELFIMQMEQGLISDKGLPMVPTYINGQLRPKKNSKAIAIDVGGTNMRVALVELKDYKTQIISMIKEPTLGKDEPVTFECFMNYLTDRIQPLLAHSTTICFSFAHEIEHNNNMDGVVKYMSKEIQIEGVYNKHLGQELKRTIKNRTGKDTKVILINDTVGVAGAMLQLGNRFQNYFGIVMGTGANSCYIEKCENIKKINDAKTDSMFINVESAAFVPSVVGAIDKEFDKTTAKPGTAIMEKMVSGEYLGKLFCFLVKKASREGLFSKKCEAALKNCEYLGTKDLSVFYESPTQGFYGSICADENDRNNMLFFAESIIERAEKLISIMIISIAKKIYEPVDKPICVIVEGSTFYKLKGFEQAVLNNIAEYAKDMDIQLHSVKDAALVGIGNIGLSFID